MGQTLQHQQRLLALRPTLQLATIKVTNLLHEQLYQPVRTIRERLRMRFCGKPEHVVWPPATVRLGLR